MPQLAIAKMLKRRCLTMPCNSKLRHAPGSLGKPTLVPAGAAEDEAFVAEGGGPAIGFRSGVVDPARFDEGRKSFKLNASGCI